MTAEWPEDHCKPRGRPKRSELATRVHGMTIRVPEDLLHRLAAHTARMQAKHPYLKMSRADIVRMWLDESLREKLMMKQQMRLQQLLYGLVGVVGMIVLVASPALASEYANPQLLVETDQLAAMSAKPDVRVVDVRAKADYDAGHIPNAVHLGFQDVVDAGSHIQSAILPNAQVAKMLGQRGIGKDTMVIFYDDTGGFRAARLFWMMEYFGHRRTAIVNGGYTKWLSEKRPITKAVPTVQATTFPIDLTERRVATADWLLDRQQDANVVVIDVRGPGAYAKGHIPWAKNIPWKGNLTADKTLKSADELHEHFATNGVTKDKNVAVHCQDGRAAAHSYFTLRLLGYPRVRSYDRSWAEWGMADDLPKVVAATNPCAAKTNPCNPCGAQNPCNPCAAKK